MAHAVGPFLSSPLKDLYVVGHDMGKELGNLYGSSLREYPSISIEKKELLTCAL